MNDKDPKKGTRAPRGSDPRASTTTDPYFSNPRHPRSPSPGGYKRPRDANGNPLPVKREDDDGQERSERDMEMDGDGGDDYDDAEEEGEDQEALAAMLGFGGFGTTKNKKVQKDVGAAEVKKQRTWRQYMNRRGGFNRPLEPVKEKK